MSNSVFPENILKTVAKTTDYVSCISDILKEVDKFRIEGELSNIGKPLIIYRGVNQLYKTDKVYPSKEEDYSKKICSGLSVKLQLQNNCKYSKGDYLNELEKMLSDARLLYPSKYENMSDLDVLADIQHNGGATCFVDFSKNILTSLWFACEKNTEVKIGQNDINPNESAYLYCYDVKYDMFVHNAVKFLTENEKKTPIGKLLNNTYRWSNVSSKDLENRFYVWEPSSKNNRIKTQGSVFLFGLETFYLDLRKHRLLIIEIPKENKEGIRKALDTYFNINENTIYRDEVGFARAHDKLKMGNTDNTPDYLYFKGIEAELEGRYDAAINMLGEYLRKNKEKKDDKLADAYFSLAICYKYRYKHSEDICDLQFAIEYYRKSAHKFLDEDHKNNARDYFINKGIRALSEIVHLCYKTNDFQNAFDCCYDLHRYNTQKDNIDIGRYILTQKEMLLLARIKGIYISEEKRIENIDKLTLPSTMGTYSIMYKLYNLIESLLNNENNIDCKRSDFMNNDAFENITDDSFVWDIETIEKEYNLYLRNKPTCSDIPILSLDNEFFKCKLYIAKLFQYYQSK